MWNQAAKKSYDDAGIFIMRAALGLFFAFHGAQKLLGVCGGMGLGAYAGLIRDLQMPLPSYMAVAIASVEFFAGIGLVVGLWSRYAAGALAILYLAAGGVVYRGAGELLVEQTTYPANVSYLLAGLGSTLVGLVLTGPGRFSLSTLLARQRVVISAGEAMGASRESLPPEPMVRAAVTREIPARVAT